MPNSAGGKSKVDGGYPLNQLARAIQSQENHEDPELQRFAAQKISSWLKVIQGLTTGTIDVGSRAPIGAPVWATPTVVTGGFATGEFAAGGSIQVHERELAKRYLVAVPEAGLRRHLNQFFTTSKGFGVLMSYLAKGDFDAPVPEESALLVAAWLVANDRPEEAAKLIEAIRPHFSQLRFFPRPFAGVQPSSAGVFLRSVAEVKKSLGEFKTPKSLLAQHEAIAFWNPLYDSAIELLLDSVDGEAPCLVEGRSETSGLPSVVGGLPCQKMGDDFFQRAKAIVEAVAAGSPFGDESHCNRPLRKSNFRQIVVFLAKLVSTKQPLSELETDRLRHLIARFVAKRGIPGSEQHRHLRKAQAQQIDIPIYVDIAQVVIERLSHYSQNTGIEDLEQVLQPLTKDERSGRLRVATELPEKISRRLERCHIDSVSNLIDRDLISSGDMLAIILPQVTASIQSSGLQDGSLRRVYESVYRAFRKRRSLLLLNLESQVRFEELPWVAAIEKIRRKSVSGRQAVLQSLREIVRLTLSSFPQAIIPNKLLQEVRSLSKTAGLELPIVDELAADIFMGNFSKKFVDAAAISGSMLQGSLYARYYEIDYTDLSERIARNAAYAKRGNHWFAEMCASRAGVKLGGWAVAKNGKVIEQQQIITTQNLAVLYQQLELAELLQPELATMALRTFDWICNRLDLNQSWHAKLISLKNSAYAWRQLVFYLSQMPDAAAKACVTEFNDRLKQNSIELQQQFKPVLGRLENLVADPLSEPHGQIFLGWVEGQHPLAV